MIAAGGAPVLLSPDMEGRAAGGAASRAWTALLLAGGNDVSPALFGEQPVEALGEVNPLRDGFEMRLVRLAVRSAGMPALGVCRGVQAMAAALGGSLWQDLPGQYRTADGRPPLKHRQTAPGQYACHAAAVLPGTLLARLLGGAETLNVNSFHHQAVKEAAVLRVCALAPDGVIEAVEHEALPFFLGVQWHPERMYRRDRAAAALFEGLVRAARGELTGIKKVNHLHEARQPTLAGAEGFEPSTKVLETHVLPLHHAPTERFESIHDLSRFVNRKIQTSVFCAQAGRRTADPARAKGYSSPSRMGFCS